MAESIYTEALAAAAEAQGSTQALAHLLRVPEATLLRWMAGRAMMPVAAFLKLLEVIAEYESGTPPAPEGDAVPEKLSFNLGKLPARCARCDATEFVATTPRARVRYTDSLACVGCGDLVKLGDLLAGLAKDAVVYARAATVARAKRHADLRAKTRASNVARQGEERVPPKSGEK